MIRRSMSCIAAFVLVVLVTATPGYASGIEEVPAAQPLSTDTGRPLLEAALEGALAQAAQPELDAALVRKASGKRKMFIGIGGMVGGVLIGTLAASNCTVDDIFHDACRGESNAALLGGLVSAGSGGVFLWGLIEWMDANGDINRANARPAGGAAIIPLGEDWTVKVAAGRRPSASLAFGW